MLASAQRGVYLHKSGIPQQVGVKCTGECIELGSGGKHLGLVALFKITGQRWTRSSLRDKDRTSAQEIHDGGNMKNMLVITGKEKHPVGLDWTAECPTELLLSI